MALQSDAAMVLFYDIAGDGGDHDDWHTYEHVHERLSIPGFLRATRWIATSGSPRYLALYEVAGVDMAHSPAYLARLNEPTRWTRAMMPRFRGMVRGFLRVAAAAGYGLGNAALAIRFSPRQGEDARLRERLASLLPSLATARGMASAQLLEPGPPPPMTSEQALRGPDASMPALLLATAYEASALGPVAAALLPELDPVARVEAGTYALHFTATAAEVVRTPANAPVLR
ncbi:MAG: hypothetical protein ACM30H_04165 [Clostridia bacterium]